MNTLRRLRIIAFLEGLSFLVLLFIAMPLKYLADMPLAVRIAGSVHGGLFLVFLAVLPDEPGTDLAHAAIARRACRITPAVRHIRSRSLAERGDAGTVRQHRASRARS